VLALRTLFDARTARGLRATVALRVGADRFRVTVTGGRLVVERGEPDDPDAKLAGEASALAAVLLGGRPAADAVR
jgi:hypothetical protein